VWSGCGLSPTETSGADFPCAAGRVRVQNPGSFPRPPSHHLPKTLLTHVLGLKSLLHALNVSWLSALFPLWLYSSGDFGFIYLFMHVGLPGSACSSCSGTKPLSISRYVRGPELWTRAALAAGFWFCGRPWQRLSRWKRWCFAFLAWQKNACRIEAAPWSHSGPCYYR